MGAPRPIRFAPLALALVLGCELTETTITDPADALVAEVYVQLGSTPDENSVVGLVHGTVGGTGSATGSAEAVEIRIRGPGGIEVELLPADVDECVDGSLRPPDGFYDCYVGDPAASARLRPGDRMELTIDRRGGGAVRGASTIPDAFALQRPVGDGERCVVPASTQVEILWSSSPGARAYVSETAIYGLSDALSVPDADTLELLGLSVSAEDTSIVFPAEFGVFDRFDLDREVAAALQEGLPPGTRADVFVTAADQNYVNWARGGSFNPSGQVRVPSLQGDGFGVFGSTVGRSFRIEQGDEGPRCAG